MFSYYLFLFKLNVLFVLQLAEGTPPEPQGAFVEYQTTMVKYSKAIAVSTQEMVSVTPFITLSTVLNLVSVLFLILRIHTPPSDHKIHECSRGAGRSGLSGHS